MGRTEKIALPEFALDDLEIEIDTGAETSSMHAFDIQEFEKNGDTYVTYKTNPWRNNLATKQLLAKVWDHRKVKGTCGKARMRPVIRTQMKIGGRLREVEFTLNDRRNMEYRFLLGRKAMEGIIVDPSAEFLLRPCDYPPGT